MNELDLHKVPDDQELQMEISQCKIVIGVLTVMLELFEDPELWELVCERAKQIEESMSREKGDAV